MRSEPARRPKPNPKEIDERIAELVMHILLRAALDAHERTNDVWRDFKQA